MKYQQAKHDTNKGAKVALTELAIKKAKPTEKPQKLADGGGMYLLIQPTGSKLWRLAYRFADKQKTLALGMFFRSYYFDMIFIRPSNIQTPKTASNILLPKVNGVCPGIISC